MNNFTLTVLVVGLLGLTACDKPTVVNTPAETVVVPVPVPGPAGPAGATGETGVQGEAGQPGGDTPVIVAPAEPAPEPLKETE